MLTQNTQETQDIVKETEAILYRVHANGIHEIILKTKDRRAVDDCMIALDLVYERTVGQESPLFLYDISVGVVSMSYLMRGLREFVAAHPRNTAKSRSAILYDKSIVLSLITPLLNLLPGNIGATAFFKSEARDQAEKWLLQIPH